MRLIALMTKRQSPQDTGGALLYWQERIAAYMKAHRGTKAQKEVGARQTVSKIETGQYNPTLEQLLKMLEAVGGDISELFRGIPIHFSNAEHRTIHLKLQNILDGAPVRAQDWLIGNIETFWDAYIARKLR